MDMMREGSSISLFQASQQWIDDLIIGFEDAVGEPVVPHELPDIFDWIELWTFGR